MNVYLYITSQYCGKLCWEWGERILPLNEGGRSFVGAFEETRGHELSGGERPAQTKDTRYMKGGRDA